MGKRIPIAARTAAVLLAVLTLAAAAAPAARPEETAARREARMKWWTDARFGMFIHFGLYALPARHEWVKKNEHITDADYQKYFENFNPDLYDPKAWVKAAKAAGMKYIVVTTKHHEGFCLWDSRITDYKATKTPYGKDLIRPLVEAARAEGLRIGFYYSLLDWHHPDYVPDRAHPQWGDAAFMEKAKGRDQKKYIAYLHDQVREILTDFGTIDTLFMDFSFPGKDGKGRADWDSEKLIRMIRELQPGIIVDDRLDLLDVPGGWDYKTPEQFMPRGWPTIDGKKVPWETCQTFSGSWGYSRDEESWKSVRQLVAMLVETVSKGGNLLLNVGPTARGTFDVRAMDRLNGIGEWMKTNGRSITGCTQAPAGFPVPQNCFLTYNPETKRLYVHVLEWPIGALALDGLAGKVAYAQLLHDASEIQFSAPEPVGFQEGHSKDTLILKLPVKKPDVVLPVVELFLK